MFPSEIEEVVLEHAALGGQYAIVLDRRTAMTNLEIRCELAEHGEPEPVAERLRRQLEERLRVRTDVIVLPPGSLPRQRPARPSASGNASTTGTHRPALTLVDVATRDVARRQTKVTKV